MTIQWKQVCVALVTGLLLGTVVGVVASRNQGDKFRQGRQIKHLTRTLDLTPDQQGRLATILDDSREKLHGVNQELRPRFQEIRKSTREEIRAILTPEQQRKFDTMEERRGRKLYERQNNP